MSEPNPLGEKFGYSIHPEPDFVNGVLKIESQIHSSSQDVATVLYREVLDTKETMVRNFLISLGWTPPPESCKMQDRTETNSERLSP